MKKHLLIMAFILAVVAITSCRKKALFNGTDCTGKCFILTGKLIDSAVNSGISGGEIKFYYRTSGLLWNTTYIGKAITDQNGNYDFRFDASKFLGSYGFFYAETYKENLFTDLASGNQAGTFSLDSVHLNIPVVQNFSMFRPSTLQVHVIAPNATNYTNVQLEYNYGKVTTAYPIKAQRPIDTVFTLKTAGDIRTFVSFKALPFSLNVQKADTVIVPANGTKLIQLQL